MVATKRRGGRSSGSDHPDEVTPEEGWALFDREARRYLNMSGEDFLRAWNAGEIDPNDPERHSAVMRVVMLLPFAQARARG